MIRILDLEIGPFMLSITIEMNVATAVALAFIGGVAFWLWYSL